MKTFDLEIILERRHFAFKVALGGLLFFRSTPQREVFCKFSEKLFFVESCSVMLESPDLGVWSYFLK